MSTQPEFVITESKLGQGTFGTVYKGFFNQRPVAIKRITRPELENSRDGERILNEIFIHKQLTHPNILTFINVRKNIQYIYIILELMTERSLYDVIHCKDIKLDEKTCRSWVKDIVTGLDYLHDSDVLHRDIKNSNVLINNLGQAKISDFGLAIKLSNANNYKHRQSGSPRILAPELIAAPYLYSVKSDIYALGILVSELSRREVPYKNLQKKEFFRCVLQGKRDQIPCNTPQVLADIIRDCSSQKASDRPSTKIILARLLSANQSDAALSHLVETKEVKHCGLKAYSGTLHVWPLSCVTLRRNTIPYSFIEEDAAAAISRP